MGPRSGHDEPRTVTPSSADDSDISVRKRSVEIAGHRTSISIEQPFWEALRDIARARNMSINELIASIDGVGGKNLSSAIRVYVLRNIDKKEQ